MTQLTFPNSSQAAPTSRTVLGVGRITLASTLTESLCQTRTMRGSVEWSAWLVGSGKIHDTSEEIDLLRIRGSMRENVEALKHAMQQLKMEADR